MQWLDDKITKSKIKSILKIDSFSHVDFLQLSIYRSVGSSSRAIARIWGLPRVWQQALNVKPHYIIEVISEKYDRLSDENKIKTLIHELLHIPKGFSGALVPHKGARKYHINNRLIDAIYQNYSK